MRNIIIGAVLIASVFVGQALSCTTFCLKSSGEILFGKNYDWMIGDGLLFVNKRGVAKTAMGDIPGTPNTAKWVSKYGSVTFNQYGRENPSGGMNEAGLVIELMWLDDTRWPKADSRPVVGTLEWIQYQLDSSGSVDDVIENANKVRISSGVKIHYLVNDRSGNSATIEFLNGELAAHMGDKLPIAALTNDTYDRSVKYSESAVAGSSKTASSLDRFTRAARASKQFAAKLQTEQEAVNYAFDTLSDVAQKGYTQWSIVYDQKRGKIHFRSQKSPSIKTIDTTAFDYLCGSAVKLFDVNSEKSGDVTSLFTDYSGAANRDLIERSFGGTPFLKIVPSVIKDQIAAYPESFACGAEPPKDENKTKSGRINLISLLCPQYFILERFYS
jgi:penicillin V acylase-like amidase (Ntn superfamily)